MDQQIRLAYLVQRRFEGLDQVVRQFADEADGVGEQERQVLDRHFAYRSVKGSKEFVLREDIGFGEQVHECRFADVRISDECHTNHLSAMLALGSHLFVNGLELLTQQGDTLTDDPFIRLYLGLTHTAVRSSTTALTIQVRPHPRQTRKHVLQMRHLNLRLRIGSLRTLEENLQNQYRSVDHTHVRLALVVQRFLYVSNLPRAQLIVKDHHVNGMMLQNILVNLTQFSFSDISSRIRQIETLSKTLNGHDTMRVGKECQLVEVFFRAVFRLVRSDQSDQHRVFYIGLDFNHQNSTFGALEAPSSASKYGFFSNPKMPARMLFGKRRMVLLYALAVSLNI